MRTLDLMGLKPFQSVSKQAIICGFRSSSSLQCDMHFHLGAVGKQIELRKCTSKCAKFMDIEQCSTFDIALFDMMHM